MRSYLLPLVSALFVSPLFGQSVPLDAPPPSEDLRSLFNRINLFGWEGDPRLWSVKDGRIRGEVLREHALKSNTFLIWRGGLTNDFELRVSFRCSPGNSSGIQYRSRKITDASAKNMWVVRGMQYDIRNEEIFPNVPGLIYDEGGRRSRLCLVGEQASAEKNGRKRVEKVFMDGEQFKKLMQLDEWNDAIIIAKGNRVLHYLNGKLVVDFTDNNPALAATSGLLAFQLQVGKPMWVEYKELLFRELPQELTLEEIVAGKTLAR